MQGVDKILYSESSKTITIYYTDDGHNVHLSSDQNLDKMLAWFLADRMDLSSVRILLVANEETNILELE